MREPAGRSRLAAQTDVVESADEKTLAPTTTEARTSRMPTAMRVSNQRGSASLLAGGDATSYTVPPCLRSPCPCWSKAPW